MRLLRSGGHRENNKEDSDLPQRKSLVNRVMLRRQRSGHLNIPIVLGGSISGGGGSPVGGSPSGSSGGGRVPPKQRRFVRSRSAFIKPVRYTLTTCVRVASSSRRHIEVERKRTLCNAPVRSKAMYLAKGTCDQRGPTGVPLSTY